MALARPPNGPAPCVPTRETGCQIRRQTRCLTRGQRPRATPALLSQGRIYRALVGFRAMPPRVAKPANHKNVCRHNPSLSDQFGRRVGVFSRLGKKTAPDASLGPSSGGAPRLRPAGTCAQHQLSTGWEPEAAAAARWFHGRTPRLLHRGPARAAAGGPAPWEAFVVDRFLCTLGFAASATSGHHSTRTHKEETRRGLTH